MTSKPSKVKRERDPLMLSMHALYRNFKHSDNRKDVFIDSASNLSFSI